MEGGEGTTTSSFALLCGFRGAEIGNKPGQDLFHGHLRGWSMSLEEHRQMRSISLLLFFCFSSLFASGLLLSHCFSCLEPSSSIVSRVFPFTGPTGPRGNETTTPPGHIVLQASAGRASGGAN